MAAIDRLWAPWRTAFLYRRTKSRRCIFCTAKRTKSQDRIHHVVARGTSTFTLLNRYPYNNGHVMIAPYRHVGTLERLTSQEWGEMLRLSQQVMKKLTRTLGPQGWNVGLNLGRTAGAGIPGHLHLHIVPRWNGDTNFFPTVSETKVISQSLDALYTFLTR